MSVATESVLQEELAQSYLMQAFNRLEEAWRLTSYNKGAGAYTYHPILFAAVGPEDPNWKLGFNYIDSLAGDMNPYTCKNYAKALRFLKKWWQQDVGNGIHPIPEVEAPYRGVMASRCKDRNHGALNLSALVTDSKAITTCNHKKVPHYMIHSTEEGHDPILTRIGFHTAVRVLGGENCGMQYNKAFNEQTD